MQGSSKKIKLLISAILAVVIIPASLFLLAPSALLSSTRVSYIFAFSSLFLFFSPWGKIRLAGSQAHKPTYKFLSWIALIFSAEVMLGLLFFSFMHTMTAYIPEQSNLTLTLQQFNFMWGLHPWPMIAVLATGLGYIYFNQKKLPLFSSFIPTFRDTNNDLKFKRIIHILLNTTTHLAVALTISMGILQIASLFTKNLAHSFNFITLLLGLVVLNLLNLKISDRSINFLCRKKLSLGGFLLGFMLISSLFFMLINILAPPQGSMHAVSAQSWDLIVWGWWIGWAPLISSFITRISYGRSIRMIVFAILIFPIILWLVSTTIPHATKQYSMLLNLLALTGPLLVIGLFSKAHSSDYFISGFLPHSANNLIARPRRTIKFIKPLLQGILLISFTYIWFGVNFISFALMLVALPSALFFVLVNLIFLGKLCSKN